ncbi:PilN domain-containing protein [Candidatus Microgenomates bacterium]|nr:PilN domain-containing protein [Candidatus Microgenomates bacterium]
MPVNLLPHKQPGFTERFFSWILTFGRFIIIGTELVVMLAFLSRFKFDRDLIDLHDKIRQEEALTKNLSSIEARSRNLHQRLSEISKIDQNAQNMLGVFMNIPELVPVNVFLDGLTLQEKRVKIEARTLSGDGLSNFINRLRSSKYFSDVILDNITRDQALGGQIKFTLSSQISYANNN